MWVHLPIQNYQKVLKEYSLGTTSTVMLLVGSNLRPHTVVLPVSKGWMPPKMSKIKWNILNIWQLYVINILYRSFITYMYINLTKQSLNYSKWVRICTAIFIFVNSFWSGPWAALMLFITHRSFLHFFPRYIWHRASCL